MTRTYKVKEYPLKVESTLDGAYFSKGWHPRETFVKEANYERFLPDEEGQWESDDVFYEVWRCMPDPDGDYDMVYILAQLGTPGAFPVTIVGV